MYNALSVFEILLKWE